MADKDVTFVEFLLKLESSLIFMWHHEANGSARVKLGATNVIATVKAEHGRPSSLHPDKGKVATFVDCSPTAAPVFEVLYSNLFDEAKLGARMEIITKALYLSLHFLKKSFGATD